MINNMRIRRSALAGVCAAVIFLCMGNALRSTKSAPGSATGSLSGLLGMSQPSMSRFKKPLVWKQGKSSVELVGMSHSQGPLADKQINIHVAPRGMPSGFHFASGSITEQSGRVLGNSGYWTSSGTGMRPELVLTFEEPAKGDRSLRSITGVYDDSYVVQRSYGPYMVGELSKPLVTKDKLLAARLTELRVKRIPYEMISDVSTRLAPNHRDMVSDVEPLRDNKHGYLVLRFLAVQRDPRVEIPNAQVYGSDGRWHQTFCQLNLLTDSRGNEVGSDDVYTGFTLSRDIFSKEKQPAKTASADGPAKEAGMRPGDVITRLGDLKITSAGEAICVPDHLVTPAKTIPVTVIRDGKQLDLQLTPIQNPIWEGTAGRDDSSLRRLVGAGKSWQTYEYAFILLDPVPLDFKPIKVKLTHGENVKATKSLTFRFRDVPFPPGFWSQPTPEK